MTTKATTKGMLDLAQVLSKNVSTMTAPKKVLSLNDLSSDQRVCYDGITAWLNRGSLTKPTLTLGGYAGCLSGDTMLAYNRGARAGVRPITLRDLYLKFNGHAVPGVRGASARFVDLTLPTYLESLWPDGTVALNRVVGVLSSGVKRVIRISFEGGKVLTLTEDHPIATPGGEFVAAGSLVAGDRVLGRGSMRPLGEGQGPRPISQRPPRVIVNTKYHPVGAFKAVESNGIVYEYMRVSRARLVVEAAMNEVDYDEFVHALKHNEGASKKFKYLSPDVDVHHVDEDTLNDDIANLEVLPHGEHARIHTQERTATTEYTREYVIAAVTQAGEEATYDIQMEPPANNFVANGIVVHNSGKSTVVSVLAHELLRRGQVAFCAFTGKAASVLSRKLSASGIATTSKVVRKSLLGGGPLFEGRPYCGTIHGLVYRPCDICMVDEQYEHNYGSRCREKENDDKELSPEERDEAAVAADPFANVAPLTSAPCLACDPPKPKRGTNGPCLRCNNARYLRRDRLDRHYSLIVVDECFHYAQRILTEDGWQTIGKIVTRKIPCRVWALNKATFQLELKPIVRWLKKPAPKELLRINAGRTDSMRSARVIRCTPAHKILTPSGYVRAGTLKVGDSLVVRGRHLTPLQFSVLVGSMLGDGSMGRHETRNSPQPYLMQGEDQLDWLKFKKAVFGEDMTGELQRGKSGYGPKIVWRFTVNVTDQARRVAEQMPWNTGQRNGRRYWTPTETFLSWVDEVALAVWYLDDGSLDVRDGRVVRAALHTECFSEETNGRLAAFLLRRFGLTAVPTPDGKGNLFLRFVQAEAERLLSIVTPFVPACMARKAPGACYAPPFVPAGEVTVAPIRAIMPTQGRARGVAYVYDLEVADHHNYIAGNVVVSNCSMVSDDILDTLLQFRVPILAVGDHGQLPPVKGAGTLMRAPDLRLETIHRQAAGSPIIALSARIRETGDIDDALEDGEAFFTMAARDLDDWIAKRFPPSRLLIDPRPPEGIMGTALISWTNRARVNLNRDVRDALGCKGKPPMKGEAVICLKNNAPIYNGMRGVLMVNADAAGDKRAPKWRCSVDFIEDGQEAIDILTCEEQYFSEKTIDFDTAQKMGVSMSKLGELYDFGYSMTCHKMQGSQVYDVGVYVEPGLSRLSRDERTRWLYTAITRAEKVLTVIR